MILKYLMLLKLEQSVKSYMYHNPTPCECEDSVEDETLASHLGTPISHTLDTLLQ